MRGTAIRAVRRAAILGALIAGSALHGQVSVEEDPGAAGEAMAPRARGSDVRRSIERILSAPEFRWLRDPRKDGRIEPSEEEEVKKDRDRSGDDRTFHSEGPTGLLAAFGQAVSGLIYVLGFAVIAILLGWILKVLLERGDLAGKDIAEDGGVETDVIQASSLPSDAYAGRAESLAAAGKLREAIRELLLGAMSWTERSSLIRFRRGLTNRDYQRALGGHPVKRDAFGRIAEAFEAIYFGRRAATVERYEECLARYRAEFHGAELAA